MPTSNRPMAGQPHSSLLAHRIGASQTPADMPGGLSELQLSLLLPHQLHAEFQEFHAAMIQAIQYALRPWYVRLWERLSRAWESWRGR